MEYSIVEEDIINVDGEHWTTRNALIALGGI